MSKLHLVKPLILTTTGLAVVQACYYNRPVPSLRMYDDSIPIRQFPTPSSEESIFLSLGRLLIMTPTYLFSRGFLKLTSNVTVIDGHKLKDAINDRTNSRGLITVSNHLSTVDDPAIISVILDISTLFQPSIMRWTLCAEEYCGKNKAMSSLFGAGKILPISRGEGKNQELLLNFADKLNVGDWCHIFPEGRIWQDYSTPSRDKNGSLYSPSGRRAPPLTKLGPLKWGTAKMITHANELPVIIPVYHFGMEELLPQNKENKLISWVPKTGKNIYIKVGDPVKVHDLIDTYKSMLLKAEEIARKNGSYGTEAWYRFVMNEENVLHVNITTRIQLSLLKLEAELLDLRAQNEQHFNHRSYLSRAKERLAYLRDAVQNKAKEKADRAKVRALGAKERTKARANLLKQHVNMAKEIARERVSHARKLGKDRKERAKERLKMKLLRQNQRLNELKQ